MDGVLASVREQSGPRSPQEIQMFHEQGLEKELNDDGAATVKVGSDARLHVLLLRRRRAICVRPKCTNVLSTVMSQSSHSQLDAAGETEPEEVAVDGWARPCSRGTRFAAIENPLGEELPLRELEADDELEPELEHDKFSKSARSRRRSSLPRT